MLATDDVTCPIIMEAKRILIEDGWIQGNFYVEGQGYCLIGALNKAGQNLTASPIDTQNAIDKVKAKVIPPTRAFGLAKWNDALSRTKTQVITVLESLCA